MAAKAAGGSNAAPVIRATDEKAKLAAEIKRTLDETAPKALSPTPRELGSPVKGEEIPMDYPPTGASEREQEWFNSLHSFDTDLVIVIDPTSEAAWIACKTQGSPKPLLLLKLPLCNLPLHNQPF